MFSKNIKIRITAKNLKFDEALMVMTAKINSKIIKKTKTVNSSLDIIWWKWTSSEGLLTFFGSKNKVELKPGGAYEIYFLLDNPIGERGGEGNKVLSYLPKKMLSFSWNAPPHFPKVRNHQHRTWVVVNFEPVDAQNTKVTLNHMGWLDGEQWDEVYDYFDSAWETVLDWLEKSCED